jgi:hypothetical protein
MVDLPPKRPRPSNIGGAARKVEISIYDFMDALDDEWRRGFEVGAAAVEAEIRSELADALRAELRDEIELELIGDPNCPLCLATKKLRQMELRVARAEIARDEAKAKLKGWSIRNGPGYKGTTGGQRV